MEQQRVVILPVSRLNNAVSATLKNFDCGDKFLNDFARKKLVRNDKRDLHKGIVAVCGTRVVGYMTTKVASLASTSHEGKSLPNKVPVLSLEQIATDSTYQNRQIGRRLLKEALSITVKVSESTGVYGLQLWSPPDALGFYERHGFLKLDTKDSGQIKLTLMFMSVDTIRKATASSR